MRSLLILISVVFLSCTFTDNRNQERRVIYEAQLTQFKDSLSNLKAELEKAESYISTAEVHQVTRTPEEKERQLKNLNDYKVELEQKIQSIESLIDVYTDSLSLREVRH